MTVDAQGRIHEPKGIPTGGQYASGGTGHGVVDDLPDMPSPMGESEQAKRACDEWLSRGFPDDDHLYRTESNEVKSGRHLREMFARQVEADPDAYRGGDGGLDQATMDDEYGTWFYENVQSPADAAREDARNPWNVDDPEAQERADRLFRRMDDGAYYPEEDWDELDGRLSDLGWGRSDDERPFQAYANACAKGFHLDRLPQPALDRVYAEARKGLDAEWDHEGSPAQMVYDRFADYAEFWNMANGRGPDQPEGGAGPVESRAPWTVDDAGMQEAADRAFEQVDDGVYEPYGDGDDFSYRMQRQFQSRSASPMPFRAYGNACAKGFHLDRLPQPALDRVFAKAQEAARDGDRADVLEAYDVFADYAEFWNLANGREADQTK